MEVTLQGIVPISWLTVNKFTGLVHQSYLRKELEEKLPKLTKWFDKLQAEPSFKKSTEKFGRGLDGCKVFYFPTQLVHE